MNLIQLPSGEHISLGEGVAACAAWPSANTASVASIGAALATFSYLFSFSIAFMYCGGVSFITVKFFLVIHLRRIIVSSLENFIYL